MMSRVRAMPRAAEIAVEACPAVKASYSLSSIWGKPLAPPCWRSRLKSARRPVSSLWA